MTDYVNIGLIETDDRLDLSQIHVCYEHVHFKNTNTFFIITTQLVKESVEFIVEGPDVIWDMVVHEHDSNRYKITVKDDELFLLLKMMA